MIDSSSLKTQADKAYSTSKEDKINQKKNSNLISSGTGNWRSSNDS